MTDIPALIARVSALTQPDRKVDALIYTALTPGTDAPFLPEYTRSVDAAIALVERVLPGYDWGRQDGIMFVSDGDDYAGAERDHAAIALVLATLKVLQAQEAHRG